jgi:hypothetical protein
MLASPRKQTNAPDFGSVGLGFFLNSIFSIFFLLKVIPNLTASTKLSFGVHLLGTFACHAPFTYKTRA